MKNKITNGIIFILSSLSLFISIKTFCNAAIYESQTLVSLDSVFGGEFWLLMIWAEFGCLALVILFSGINLFSKK